MAKEPALPLPKPSIEETILTESIRLSALIEQVKYLEQSLGHVLKVNKVLGDEVSQLRMELDELKTNGLPK